ncbi:MAG TPA: MlaD family protein [Candidatus Limnocylindria bacterium]|nr:MlaD family protein [Candidatus Limnocylindria bacterium]
MRNTLETRLGIFFALTLIVAVIILEMVGVADFFKPGYHVFGDFKTVQELKKGDLVKMAGVEIGRVEKIDLANEKVRVTMKIKKQDADVKTDSKATIKFTGLLGQNFVALDFGSPNGIKAVEGAILSTAEQPDLSAIMTKLDNVAGDIQGLTKSFTPDSLAPIFGPITDFMKNNSTNLSLILDNTRAVTEQVSNGKGTVGRLLYDDTLYNTALSAVVGLQAGTTELKSTVLEAKGMMTNANSIISQINAGQGTLGKLAKDETLYREMTLAMTNAREILEKVNKGQGSVGKLVNDESLYKNVKVSLQKLDKATEGLEDQGPLSVLGIAVQSLF